MNNAAATDAACGMMRRNQWRKLDAASFRLPVADRIDSRITIPCQREALSKSVRQQLDFRRLSTHETSILKTAHMR
jgi:hypothetical protein